MKFIKADFYSTIKKNKNIITTFFIDVTGDKILLQTSENSHRYYNLTKNFVKWDMFKNTINDIRILRNLHSNKFCNLTNFEGIN